MKKDEKSLNKLDLYYSPTSTSCHLTTFWVSTTCGFKTMNSFYTVTMPMSAALLNVMDSLYLPEPSHNMTKEADLVIDKVCVLLCIIPIS